MSNEERIETLKELCNKLKSDVRSYTELYDAKMIVLNSNLDVIYSDENVQNSPELKILTKEYVNAILNEIKNILTSRIYHNKVIMDEATRLISLWYSLENICNSCHSTWVIVSRILVEIQSILNLIAVAMWSIACYLDEIDTLNT